MLQDVQQSPSGNTIFISIHIEHILNLIERRLTFHLASSSTFAVLCPLFKEAGN